MIILRALPLSLSVFLRFLLIAPFLAIAIFCYSLVGGLLAVILGLISPPLAFLLFAAIVSASWVIPTMVGTRLALQSLGETPSISYGNLLMPSIMYGLIEAIVYGLTWGIVIGGVLLMTPVDFNDIIRYMQTEGTHQVEGVGPLLIAGVFLLTGMGYVVVRSLLLVPLAAAAIGRDPDGSFYTPLKNFGAGLVPLLFLSGVSVALYYAAPIIAVLSVSWFIDGFSPTLSVGKTAWLTGEFWAIVAVTYAVMLLGLSLQCAGAALVYMKLREQTAERTVEEVPRMSEQDVRDLWKSRMPGGGD